MQHSMTIELVHGPVGQRARGGQLDPSCCVLLSSEFLHRVVPYKDKPLLLLYDNFGKCGPISIILSLLHLVINCAQTIPPDFVSVATLPCEVWVLKLFHIKIMKNRYFTVDSIYHGCYFFYLRQVNIVNGEDNVFIGFFFCLSFCLSVCSAAPAWRHNNVTHRFACSESYAIGY